MGKKPVKLEDVIKSFLVTEKALRLATQNYVVAYVDLNADKKAIKNAMEKIYKVKVVKVNVLNTSKNKKKVYVKLSKEFNAEEFLSKLGLI